MNNNITINPISHDNKEPIKKEVGQLSVDIYHTDNEIVILAPIAGVEESGIDISLTEDVLVIKGERPKKEEISEENYYTKECFWGNFSRAIVLPNEADTRNISANFKNNVLEIRIPKNQEKQTKIIKIKSKE
jgi:HSP20 family protein